MANRKIGVFESYVQKGKEEDEEEKEEEKESLLEPDEEYTQDAFIPSFTVAPEEIPEYAQVKVPTPEQKQATLESLLKKTGVKAKEILHAEPIPMTPEMEKAANSGSLMGARLLSTVMMWGYSVIGLEYGILAPSVEQSHKMLYPIGRIVVRHVPMVGKISPDAEDAIEAFHAISEYANHTMIILTQIREEKAANNGRYRTFERQTGAISATPRHDDTVRHSTNSTNNAQDVGMAVPEPIGNLTEAEQYNRAMLRTLSERDINHRVRRSGII